MRVHLDYAHANPILYRYAAGVVRFPRFAELQRARLAAYARTLGGERPEPACWRWAPGNATYQMVLGTLEADRGRARPRRRAHHVVHRRRVRRRGGQRCRSAPAAAAAAEA